jgi:hypothetical protein
MLVVPFLFDYVELMIDRIHLTQFYQLKES